MALKKKNYAKYVKAYELRYIKGLKLEAVAKEMGFKSIERGRYMANWVKFQLSKPNVRIKEILDLKKRLEQNQQKSTKINKFNFF